METKKIVLPDSELPQKWYNIQADLPTSLEPPLHPGTGQPIGPEDLSPIFPMPLIEPSKITSERSESVEFWC